MHHQSIATPGLGQDLFKSAPIRIGRRHVEFLWCGGDSTRLEHHFLAVWDPSPPSRWKATHLEIYRKARDAFLAQVNERLGFKPILVDVADLEGVGPVRQAAEVMLKARAAGISVNRDGIHGDSALLDAWRPVLDAHGEGISALLAARPVR